ncbi:dual oxidase maturation factor 1-like isoform X2 [Ruditapes philippinarum]|uniref:dual oxidase maturation factor 1-like isoform X2 n=1 Tax=Ruditapes philippinarum TaxID=129788 RepID=UPI00295A6CEC|nr:dual oxidase maturation factor 1-like isoform X2 [Ruditapes philippinarum]
MAQVIISTLSQNVTDGYSTRMTWFRAFRGDFGYSNYGDYRTSVTWDIPFAAIIYTCILISLAAIIAAAGIRGKERWYTLVRLVYSLAVGSIILVSVFGYCWQLGEVGVHSPYIYRSNGHIKGSLGVRIGLKTINLTLQGKFHTDENSFNYNEEIELAGVIRPPSQTWNALERGLPQPLLSIIEHFDIDAGGLRFGRASFMAGYFANILLWAAFAFWVTGNILLCSVIWYGAACFTLTGVCMVLAAVVYDYLCPQSEIRMPCSDGTLVLTYGWCFWSTLVFGILTTLVGLILFTLDQKVPKKLAEFFLLDNTLDENEEYKQIPATANGTDQTYSQNTPDTSFRCVNERRTSQGAPVNWYVNYGYDSQRSHKGNPIYNEPVLDTSFTRNESFDSIRPRAFSNIKEEDDQNETKSETDIRFGQQNTDVPLTTDPDMNLDRLSGIYVDVEPNHKGLSINGKRQPYIKELDAMSDNR